MFWYFLTLTTLFQAGSLMAETPIRASVCFVIGLLMLMLAVKERNADA